MCIRDSANIYGATTSEQQLSDHNLWETTEWFCLLEQPETKVELQHSAWARSVEARVVEGINIKLYHNHMPYACVSFIVWFVSWICAQVPVTFVHAVQLKIQLPMKRYKGLSTGLHHLQH